ncbi:hypothetical protein SASPL_133209 [Salvia splendens]|uniref:WRKY domain-containing protein n=1 Tax=Salvia splendens TaxID=180675 RepID=A0A8X8ZHU8_SALSN|nr:hypothetical protein SASPL_133209 [Salvia splendens]
MIKEDLKHPKQNWKVKGRLNQMAENELPPSSSKPPPSITLPPRTSFDTLFTAGSGASPGPMSLVSSFFAENDPDNDSRSFSQLLAGALPSPAERSGEFRFQQNRLADLGVTHLPGAFPLPPASLLNSTDFISSQGVSSYAVFPGTACGDARDSTALENVLILCLQLWYKLHHLFAGLGHSGLSHQLAQISGQAQMQFQYPSAPMLPLPSFQNMSPPLPDTMTISESSDFSQSANLSVDKPTDDGFNWRKYGQKPVKGSEFPRSYYKCTHPSCPVKKKVERSHDGQISEIIYKGQHNHPQRPIDTRTAYGTHRNSEFSAQSLSKPNEGSRQLTPEQVSGSSGSEEVVAVGIRVDDGHEGDPESKRRIVEVQNPEQTNSSHRTEPRIIIQTTSEVDLLDDGYRWRKYGQKVVKGNPHPRSYYKCTTADCNVRKHVERAASDPKDVITTYEGKHNHSVPAAKNSSHSNANAAATQFRPHNPVANRPVASRGVEYGNEQQSIITLLRFKEEEIT